MNNPASITTLFVDIGGVLLTNGWDHNARLLTARAFDMDFDEMDERHHLTFDTYEEGKLTLAEYLDRVVFYQPRSFSKEEFQTHMFAQSQPYTEMIEMARALKQQYGLHVAAVSNEGRELTIHRIQKFNLKSVIDFFISSCFVHIRKPDLDIYRIALDIAQASPEQVVYIEDRSMFVELAQGLGIRSILHSGYPATRAALADIGLRLRESGA
jgi:putative hydrolase of the HAD superfamily